MIEAMISRRAILIGSVSCLAVNSNAFSQSLERNEKKMNFDILKNQAFDLVKRPYHDPIAPHQDILSDINYLHHQSIKVPPSKMIGYGTNQDMIDYFHPGAFFRKKVKLFTLNNGMSREILYNADLFSMKDDNPARKITDLVGFAGFRIHDGQNKDRDWLAFLGASYFRMAGDLDQYGSSARGLLIDAATSRAEEFPDFIEHHITPFQNGKGIVLSLMDSPSVSGAFEFNIDRQTASMMVRVCLYMRHDVERFGMAPITSMYAYSETRKGGAQDWRPEVHDCDTLFIHNGQSEWIARPLNNPPKVMVSYFQDSAPKGFGLIQEDRNYDHYLDNVQFERRPSVWVEPVGDWPKGSVQLMELPTHVEFEDNIAAFYVPEQQPKPYEAFEYSYKISFTGSTVVTDGLAKLTATRLDFPKDVQNDPRTLSRRSRMIAFEFEGDNLNGLDIESIIKDVSLSSGVVFDSFIMPYQEKKQGRLRLFINIGFNNDAIIEMRVLLRRGKNIKNKNHSSNDPLTQTVLYQLHVEQI